jgi:iron-sulfur cluster assembly protein
MAVTLTESAKSRARHLAAERGANTWLRLAIRGGGCSGLMYEMDWVVDPTEGDKTFDIDGVRVCIDKKSYLFLNGIELDYEDTLVKSGFVFHNPAAKRSCSCGESFTL